MFVTNYIYLIMRHLMNPNHIEEMCSLVVLGGGGTLSHVSVVAVSNRDIYFIKAVLLLREHRHRQFFALHGLTCPPPLREFRVKERVHLDKSGLAKYE